jgi:hypothetical protein
MNISNYRLYPTLTTTMRALLNTTTTKLQNTLSTASTPWHDFLAHVHARHRTSPSEHKAAPRTLPYASHYNDAVHVDFQTLPTYTTSVLTPHWNTLLRTTTMRALLNTTTTKLRNTLSTAFAPWHDFLAHVHARHRTSPSEHKAAPRTKPYASHYNDAVHVDSQTLSTYTTSVLTPHWNTLLPRPSLHNETPHLPTTHYTYDATLGHTLFTTTFILLLLLVPLLALRLLRRPNIAIQALQPPPSVGHAQPQAPPFIVTHGLKVMLINVGGLPNRWDDTLRLATDANVDILLITETWLSDHSFAAQMKGLGIRSAVFKNRDTRGRVSGGVGAISLKKHVRIHRHPSSTLSDTLTISVDQEGYKPIAITIAYVPDATADMKARAAGHPTTTSTYADIEQHAASARKRFGFDSWYLAGDFNATANNINGRLTESLPGTQPRSIQLQTAIRSLQITPTHGRTTPALTTSRPIASDYLDTSIIGKEVDYIMGPHTTPHAALHFAGERSWPSFTSHRPICATLPLYLRAPGPNLPPPQRPPRPIPLPPRSDPAWKRYGAKVRDIMSEISGDTDPAASANTLEKLSRLLVARAVECFTASEASFDSVLQTTRSTYSYGKRGNWHAGAPVPPHIHKLLHEADAIERKYRDARTAGLRGETLESLKLAAYECRRSARRARAAHYRQWDDSFLRSAEHQRRTDARRFHKSIKNMAPDNNTFAPTAQIPQNNMGTPANVTFTDFFKRNFTANPVCPSGPTDPARMAHVPRWTGTQQYDDTLARRFSKDEVYNVLFPATKDVKACACNDPASCSFCTLFNAQLESSSNAADTLSPPPSHKPHITTGSAAGPDRVRPELLRWSLGTGARSHNDRYKLCTILADAYNHALDTGTVPDLSTENRSTPIFKEPKPGQTPPDPSDPTSYRYLTVGNCLHKILELVIQARLDHWSSQQGLRGPEQVGFTVGNSTEEHVFTLFETIRHQWRHNASVYALFVDLRRAYDMVNHDALFAVLEHMGIPPKLTTLIRNWFLRRTTCVVVNGVSSEKIDVTIGVGQGSILSPLLFILFIESLNRTLRADPRLNGVTITSPGLQPLTIKGLFYADDIVILALTPAELNIALAITTEWCAAWHMQVGTGRGKSEAIAFISPVARAAAPNAPLLNPLVSGHTIVDWVHSYKYLGLIISDTLDLDTHEADSLAHMQSNYYRYLLNVAAVREGPGLLTRQTFMTYVSTSATYLVGVLPSTDAYRKAADAITSKAARLILPGASDFTSPSFLLGVSGLLPLSAIALSQRARLHLHLTNYMHLQSIAARLYAHLRIENAAGSWVGESAAINRLVGGHEHAARVLPALDATGFPAPHAVLASNEITRRFAHASCTITWNAQNVIKYNAAATKRNLPPLCRSTQHIPSVGGQAVALAAITDAFATRPCDLDKRAIPGSICPGTGSLLAHGTDPTLPRHLRAALLYLIEGGRRGFFSEYAPTSLATLYGLPQIDAAPEAPTPRKCSKCRLEGHTIRTCTSPNSTDKCRTCKETGHSTTSCINTPAEPSQSDNYNKEWARLVNGSSKCPLCDLDEPLGSAHLITRCTNPTILTQRAAVIAQLPTFVGTLVTHLERTRSWVPTMDHIQTRPRPSDPHHWSDAALAASDAVCAINDWTQGDGAWILFHALTATPWSLFSIDETPAHLRDGPVRTLANEFEGSRNFPTHCWRPLINWWLRWAGSRAHNLYDIWRREAESLPSRPLAANP